MEDPNLRLETDNEPGTPETPQPASEPTVPPTEPVTPPVEPAVPPVNYEEKFAHSTRENQILAARLAEIENSRRELTINPTDSDVRAAFPEWEYMSATEQRLARESFTARRTSEALLAKEQERELDARWNTDLELAAAQNPSLLGKEQAFKAFASKKQYRGTPIDVLADAFLHKASATAAPPAPAPRQPGLESGTGGPKTPERPKMLSPEDLKTLRETDPAAYRTYVRTHDVSQIDL